ncbi:exosortase system-associated protein, TIGR04073 family [bacterium]|nr:exosortase system-associated protein, TIGR04073 family [Akkermansiaceae bacterium]MDB4456535.1 exosortase system-associated protein, TIGR04073 family [bacterium]MDB4562390.1 exosortase system-associated protein, TIGR04073 family [Akkermansiaceae bacterium]MDB4577548.1 exosortase system-associated protein, TIGR04073 family [bacterium]
MRKLLLITLALGMAAPVFGDVQAPPGSTLALELDAPVFGGIQTPPGSKYTSKRKLGRAISNILYGVMEIPERIVRTASVDGRNAGYPVGVVVGTRRAFRRMGYGFYELFTFHCPIYHGTFKPPYTHCGSDDRIEMNPAEGLSEFPPELGAESYFSHSRTQKF